MRSHEWVTEGTALCRRALAACADQITAYLAGRPYTDVRTTDDTAAEPLPPWL